MTKPFIRSLTIFGKVPSISSMPAAANGSIWMPRIYGRRPALPSPEQPAPRVLAMYQESNARELRDTLFQQLEPFSAQLRGLQGETSDVAARSSKAFNKPGAYRVRHSCHDDGIVFVEFFAALIAGVETATIRSTLERTSSLAISGRRSSFSSAYRYSMVMLSPST